MSIGKQINTVGILICLVSTVIVLLTGYITIYGVNESVDGLWEYYSQGYEDGYHAATHDLEWCMRGREDKVRADEAAARAAVPTEVSEVVK